MDRFNKKPLRHHQQPTDMQQFLQLMKGKSLQVATDPKAYIEALLKGLAFSPSQDLVNSEIRVDL